MIWCSMSPIITKQTDEFDPYLILKHYEFKNWSIVTYLRMLFVPQPHDSSKSTILQRYIETNKLEASFVI